MSRGWFGPKTIGWGVSPTRWQGWLVTVVLLAGLAASIRWLRPTLEDATGLPPVILTLAMIAVWLAIFLLVISLTYERSDRRH
jgi:ribose/xylose/arabinose/galactoside ABC-type transport system permease subunit